jgi:hypothetical protein
VASLDKKRIGQRPLHLAVRSILFVPLLLVASGIIRKLLARRQPPAPPVPFQAALHGDWRWQDPSTASWWTYTKEVVDRHAAVLAILGLVVYVMVRAAYESFYGSLGATPEEVGLSYLLIIARAALGLFAYLTILTILLLVATVVARALLGDDYSVTPRDLPTLLYRYESRRKQEDARKIRRPLGEERPQDYKPQGYESREYESARNAVYGWLVGAAFLVLVVYFLGSYAAYYLSRFSPFWRAVLVILGIVLFISILWLLLLFLVSFRRWLRPRQSQMSLGGTPVPG